MACTKENRRPRNSCASHDHAHPEEPVCQLEEVVDEATWKRREMARSRQVNIGKTRPEYKAFNNQFPKETRTFGQPVTPSVAERVSKRMFDKKLKAWRRQLHSYDDSEMKEAKMPEIPLGPWDDVRTEVGSDTFGNFVLSDKNHRFDNVESFQDEVPFHNELFHCPTTPPARNRFGTPESLTPLPPSRVGPKVSVHELLFNTQKLQSTKKQQFHRSSSPRIHCSDEVGNENNSRPTTPFQDSNQYEFNDCVRTPSPRRMYEYDYEAPPLLLKPQAQRQEFVSALLLQAKVQTQDSGLALAPEAHTQMQDSLPWLIPQAQMQDAVIAMIPQAQMQMQLMPQAQMQMQDSVLTLTQEAQMQLQDSMAAIIPVQTGQGINMLPCSTGQVFVCDYDGTKYYPMNFSGQ